MVVRSWCKVNRDDGKGDGVHDIGFLTLNTTGFQPHSQKIRVRRTVIVAEMMASEMECLQN